VSFDAAFAIGAILETSGFLLLMAFVAQLAESTRGWSGTRWTGTVALASVIVATVLTILAVVALSATTLLADRGGAVDDGYVVLSDVRLAVYWLSLPAWALVFLTIGSDMARMPHRVVLGWVARVVGAGLLVVMFIESVGLWGAVTGVGGLWLLATAGQYEDG
jgi:hypothetical protein